MIYVSLEYWVPFCFLCTNPFCFFEMVSRGAGDWRDVAYTHASESGGPTQWPIAPVIAAVVVLGETVVA